MRNLDASQSVFLEISEQEFRQWQHTPLTKAFFQFLGDQLENFREVAAVMVEEGAFTAGERNPSRNPDVVRGRLMTLRELQGIALADIQGFYGKEEPQEAEDVSQDE